MTVEINNCISRYLRFSNPFIKIDGGNHLGFTSTLNTNHPAYSGNVQYVNDRSAEAGTNANDDDATNMEEGLDIADQVAKRLCLFH